MNRSVYKSLFWLTIGTILFCYVAKFFWPELFLITIDNPRLIAIGNFIDSNRPVYFVCGLATSFLTYYLYICACCGLKSLTQKQSAAVVAVLVLLRGCYGIRVEMGMHLSILSMIAIPAIVGCSAKDLALVFGVHYSAQALSLATRNQILNIGSYNFLAFSVLSIDAYLWLALLYMINRNRREGELLWDGLCPLFTERTRSFWKRRFPNPKP